MATSTSTLSSSTRVDAGAAATQLAWLACAAALGWTVTTVFSGVMALPRNLFLVPYIGITAAFLAAYVKATGVRIGEVLRDRWGRGVVGAAVAGAFAVWAVRIQRPSPMPQGLELVGSLVWLGVAYAVIDASLISVLPVFATKKLFAAIGWARTPAGRVGAGLAALAASAIVNVAYHTGYAEISARAAVGPLVGNTVLTLAYVISGNPLAAILSHIALHVTAVLHAVDTAHQLPPHT